MTERLRDTASRRHGHLLLLSGEAGAGKTTLLEAFRNDHRGTET
jgi:predicted ATPase